MAANSRYSVLQPHVSDLISMIRLGQIAIPEIQRPFVWEPSKVRNLFDSLYQGYPIGFLIGWKNPDVKLKDGTTSDGKRILIDGQQRVTALMTALLGAEVVTKSYEKVRIQIMFNPLDRRFEVFTPVLAKDPVWIPDIAAIFAPDMKIFHFVQDYCARNPSAEQGDIFESIDKLAGIVHNQIGFIELAHDLDIDTVTEIFVRVNSAGVPLGQADFAMSKIAVNEAQGGGLLRKAIDYFCHLAVAPDFMGTVKNDQEFVASQFFPKLSWLKNETDSLYDPSYTDMLRVSFTSEFKRARLSDLVALLSGRNFETKEFEDRIVQESFERLKQGVARFMNETNFKQLLMILKSAGFVEPAMIGSSNAINFAYILYLMLKERKVEPGAIQRTVARWFVMSLLTLRHSGSFETRLELDVRRFAEDDPLVYAEQVFLGELSDAFWNVTLPQRLATSGAQAQPFQLYKAAQIKQQDKGFLSRDFDVFNLVTVKSDVHHVFPKDVLKKRGLTPSQYNQIANFVIAQSEINIRIGNKQPTVYFKQLCEQAHGGPKRYGNIQSPEELCENFRMNCIPDGMAEMTLDDYPAFLAARRTLMAAKIRAYFESL